MSSFVTAFGASHIFPEIPLQFVERIATFVMYINVTQVGLLRHP
jgi:hypothetical protein